MFAAGKTFAATVAQQGLNAALLACPITWIVVGVIALVAGIIDVYKRQTEPNEEAAQVAQSVVLYIDPSVDIPEGSKVTVTQNGVTRDYERSGTPAVYSTHQEIPLELFRGWA